MASHQKRLMKKALSPDVNTSTKLLLGLLKEGDTLLFIHRFSTNNGYHYYSIFFGEVNNNEILHHHITHWIGTVAGFPVVEKDGHVLVRVYVVGMSAVDHVLERLSTKLFGKYNVLKGKTL